MKLWRHLNVHLHMSSVLVAVGAFAFCQQLTVLSSIVLHCVCVCVSCVHCSVCCCVQHVLWITDCINPPCVCFLCVCVYVSVCVGGYCRSACSCRISCKEHESPGNAQKHQHWWHQHKSAKSTFLQIVSARSWACRC